MSERNSYTILLLYFFDPCLGEWDKNTFNRLEPSILSKKLEVGGQQTVSRIAIETKQFLRPFRRAFCVCQFSIWHLAEDVFDFAACDLADHRPTSQTVNRQREGMAMAIHEYPAQLWCELAVVGQLELHQLL